MKEFLKQFRLPQNSYFYYNIIGQNSNSYILLYSNFLQCLGYIGDLITGKLFDISESNLFFTDNCEYYIILINTKYNKKLINTAKRINVNWQLNAEIKQENGLLRIKIPSKDFLATRWKVQAMMQILRAIFNKTIITKTTKMFAVNNINYNSYSSSSFNNELDCLYSLSFAPLDNSFTAFNDRYHKSHGEGALFFSQQIFNHYVSKNKISASKS